MTIADPGLFNNPSFTFFTSWSLFYKSFYKKYENYSIKKLIAEFNITVKKITDLIEIYTEKELFDQNQRQWASSTPSNWPIWKWIHINTVAPFKTFRTKIRKWKKLKI